MGWDDEKGNFLVKFFHVISYPNPIVKQAGDRKRQTIITYLTHDKTCIHVTIFY